MGKQVVQNGFGYTANMQHLLNPHQPVFFNSHKTSLYRFAAREPYSALASLTTDQSASRIIGNLGDNTPGGLCRTWLSALSLARLPISAGTKMRGACYHLVSVRRSVQLLNSLCGLVDSQRPAMPRND